MPNVIVPYQNIPTGLTLRERAAPRRVLRKPSHPFHLRNRPFQIQPFAIAPVLPGETLENALLQARVVTDPIKNPLIGWWHEFYLFYIPLRAIPSASTYPSTDENVGTIAQPTTIENMLLDMAAPLADNMATSLPNYGLLADGGFDWVKECLQLIVENYFRDTDEGNVATLDGLYQSKIVGNNWSQSVTGETVITALDQTVDVNATPTPDNFSVEEMDTKYRTWLLLTAQQMTEKTFDEYLGDFGVRVPQRDQLKPELIRFVREWTYPANTIDPTNGTPRSACSWSITERADKKRFFREPGFIFGVTTTRPKVYMSNQTTNAASMLNNCLSWLPAMMKDQVSSSLKLLQEDTGPLGNRLFNGTAGQGYWVDMRDLFVHGDQFINFAVTETNAGLVAVPASTTNNNAMFYAPDADIDALFVTPGTDSATAMVRQDGVLSLGIMGTQLDHTN